MKLPLMLMLVASVGTQAQSAQLRIVVVEGEDAVNIVQQKTAVRPLVEVRDRNNLPVSGATVTFTIGGGQPAAFAGGVQTLTVTTNAAGQAAAGGFNVLGAGSVQIQVQAAYQGQIATAAISQTNFATAAAAAQAGAGGGGASGASGGATAAGGGGGVSATTIGIVGAAVAGGAVAATQTGVLGGEQELITYTGSFTGQFPYTTVNTGGPQSPSICTFTRVMTGTLKIELNEDGTSGKATVETSQTEIAVTGTCFIVGNSMNFGAREIGVAGGPSALAFSHTETGNNVANSSRADRYTFSGSLSGSTITGSLAIETSGENTRMGSIGLETNRGSGSLTVAVTLQR
jgi:hypothetical protein